MWKQKISSNKTLDDQIAAIEALTAALEGMSDIILFKIKELGDRVEKLESSAPSTDLPT